ncbi:MAG: SgcJ/EcaC family oxidoreductase [Gemmatimonadetes bacterium]|nr:SgcJ/EcaC family oxidoreductase [Gemmatimonadota bacterium]
MSDAAAAIAATNERFMAAFNRGDAAGVASHYTSDGQLFPANSDVIQGIPAIEEFWEGAMSMGIKSVQLTATEIDDQGDTAIEIGNYHLSGEGGVPLDQGQYLVVWKLDGGAWKLHRDMWTTSNPPA